MVRGQRAKLSGEARDLDRIFSRVYRATVVARRALEATSDRQGVEVAVQVLAWQPERLGVVLEEEWKVWMGLGICTDRTRAYHETWRAQWAAREYLKVRSWMLGPAEVTHLEVQAQKRSERIGHLERELRGMPDDRGLMRRTGERAAGLPPDRMSHLSRALGRDAALGQGWAVK